MKTVKVEVVFQLEGGAEEQISKVIREAVDQFRFPRIKIKGFQVKQVIQVETEKVQISDVILYREEEAISFMSFAEADAQLRLWASVVPLNQIQKIDFHLAFRDGEKFVGEMKLTTGDADKSEILASRVREFVRFHAGLEMGRSHDVQALLDLMKVDPDKYLLFYCRYDIGQGEAQ